jgi:hypothetical protein
LAPLGIDLNMVISQEKLEAKPDYQNFMKLISAQNSKFEKMQKYIDFEPIQLKNSFPTIEYVTFSKPIFGNLFCPDAQIKKERRSMSCLTICVMVNAQNASLKMVNAQNGSLAHLEALMASGDRLPGERKYRQRFLVDQGQYDPESQPQY